MFGKRNNNQKGNTMEIPMMKCGHAANAVQVIDNKEGHDVRVPVCAVCILFTPDALVVDKSGVENRLEERMAKCSYDNRNNTSHADSTQPSSPNLAFFRHQPDKAFDEYYCGCFGWG